MKISCYTGGMVQTNGYLVETADGNFLVDAPSGVAGWISGKGVRLDGLYLTHQHYDHVEDVSELRKSGVKVFAWADYSKDLTLETYGASWGLPEVSPFAVDELVPVGKREVLGMEAVIAHVPGHSADSISFYFPGEKVVFVGDALFSGSVGRCDLPGGSFELLLEGIKRDLLTLPDDTKVLPGHGPGTTIGRERSANGYLK
ncbi:MBL fold metallo-hydrolase [Luteolibacter sp. AS25]|uniref:MBL fold metallo-hydrolase n=1 Tax=Luteolibacter sp. AS25 TaxID=3135776 RepID=UPI00398B6763